MELARQSDDLLLAKGDVVALSRTEVEDLKSGVPSTARGRSRISTHASVEDRLHEMLIVLERRTYVRPHRHPGKTESFHVVEGAADVVLFDEGGDVTDVIQMGSYASGRVFFYRLNAPVFHTVLVRSPQLVVHETTNGPFDRRDTVAAPWAPGEDDAVARLRFTDQVEARVTRFSEGRPARI